MHKTAFFTVVYPGIEKYFEDFAASVQNQTSKAFDLIIFNENSTDIDFVKLLKGIRYKIIPTTAATPIIIRERGFVYLRKEKYSHVIFGDADDWFSDNRVEKSLELLEDFDLVINDVDIVTDNETLISHYFSCRLANRTIITKKEILLGNFMGLSAAAIKLDALPEFITPQEVVALDWYMFTRMIHEGSHGVFTNEMKTFYRQYDSNLVGMKQVTQESLKREISVKYAHYKALQSFGSHYKLYTKNFKELLQKVVNAEELNQLYSKIKKNPIDHPYWWENTQDGVL